MTTSWLSNAARRLPAPGRVATIVRGTHALLILRSADPHAQAPNLRRAGPHGHRGGPGAHASPSARAARGPRCGGAAGHFARQGTGAALVRSRGAEGPARAGAASVFHQT